MVLTPSYVERGKSTIASFKDDGELVFAIWGDLEL